MKLYQKLNISDFLYQKIVEKLKREPNDFETYLFSAMHSEHCGYMHSKKYINDFYKENNYENENSGCIRIKDYCIFFKMESHNHPCAIEPYQGSMTGIGGIVRDVLSLGAKPIALSNSLKFGSLDKLKTKYYIDEISRGISDYGNSIGVPTITGETIFDKRFNNLPIVNVLALGIIKEEDIKLSSAKEDNLIVLLGSKTGVDGLNGASFASGVLDENASRQSVQIGDPYTKKRLIDAVLEINKLKEITACQDLGASGILSSTSEMAYKGNCTVELYLEKVHTQINSIKPEEIMLSESQERMAFTIENSACAIEKFDKIAKKYELDYSVIGKTQKGHDYKVYYNNKLLCSLDVRVLCEPYLFDLEKKEIKNAQIKRNKSDFDLFKDMINDDNFSSKEFIYSQFDQEVQGRTSFSQKENSIGILYLKETESFIGLLNQTTFDIDPKKAVYNAFMSSYRKLVSFGFELKGITNCLNFANPENLSVQSDFRIAVDELKRLSFLYKVPVVSGNVSFYNEIKDEKIPPAVTLGCVGVCENKNRIIKSKINKNDKICILKNHDEIKTKEIIFNLLENKKVKKVISIGSFGLIGSLLKEALFYDLGFKISYKNYFEPYQKDYILITDNEIENAILIGEIIDDKIVFDNNTFEKEKIKNIYFNKLTEKMK